MIRIAAAVLLLSFVPSAANALCVHDGRVGAKTTLGEEFGEAQRVVRARLLSATNWTDRARQGTLYHLQLVTAFKGGSAESILLSTEREANAFVLESRDGQVKIGEDYLLFLVPNPRPGAGPPSVRRAFAVNYNCGQSREWDAVSEAEKDSLRALAE